MSAIGGAEWDGGERVEICMDSDFGLGSDWSGGVGDGVRFGAKTPARFHGWSATT